MNKNLLNEFDDIYDKYLQTPDLYRIDVIRPNTNIPDINFNIMPNNVPVPNIINDILTKSITKYFLNSTETILEIIGLYIQIYEYAINKYIQTYPQYNLNENKIWFSLKGGLAMFLNISKEVFKMPGNIGDIFNNLFVNNSFSKSDIDFSILIDYDEIEERYYRIIFSDMMNISFIILVIVRNYIIKNKYKFSDFEKNNDEFKKLILKKIRTDINQTLLNRGIGRLGNNFCKIGTSKIYEEAPCPNNVEITNDIAYDELYVHSQADFNNITINHPKRFGHFNLGPQSKYIISSNIIQFLNAQNNRIKFGLTRMKVFFGLYKLNINNQTLGCCDYKKGKGEIIDVGISHYENYINPKYINYNRFTINQYVFIMPTLNYFKKDLYEILVIFYNLPWEAPKFEKRLDRYFSFALIILFNGINTQRVNQLLIFFTTYRNHLQLNNSEPNYNNNPLMNNQLNYQNITQAQNPIEFEILTILNQTIRKLNQQNYNAKLNKFTEFINKLSLIINNVIDVLNETNNYLQNPILTFQDNNLSVRTNMFGGVDICNMDDPQKILKNTINKLINISTYLPLDTNIHDRFYNTYRKLIQIYLNENIIEQKFIDNLGNTIYDSSTDLTDRMQDFNGNAKILKNTILNYTAFMFMDYLLDYHCFLITFQDERYNTDISNVPNGTKNFMTLDWDGDERESDLYRHELLGKNPGELLKDFCYDINTKFYRFIELLLKNLSIELSKFLPINLPANPQPPNNLTSISIDDLKQVMFAINHRGIYNYIETSLYNYMFHCWKNMLANWMRQKFQGLARNNFPRIIPNTINMGNLKNYFITIINTCILNTIDNISNQDGINEYNERYIADSGGLFSYSYMLKRPLMRRNGYNKKTYYSSCISSSIIEMYFLIRIYETPNNVGLGSETAWNNISMRHAFWTITQREIRHGISHWTCKWNRLVFNAGVFTERIHIFRNANNNANNRTIMLSNANSKKSFLKYFLFQLIDYRIEYIRQNNFGVIGGVKSAYLSDNVAINIRNYIL